MCVSEESHDRNSPNFLLMLPVTVTQSPSDNVSLRYVVLPVLWSVKFGHVVFEIREGTDREADRLIDRHALHNILLPFRGQTNSCRV